MNKENVSDYDSGWKEVIPLYFEEFITFFFPKIHGEIDFKAGFEFLDKEFNKIVKDSAEKKRYVDKLVKVYLKNGREKWLLIHIEVQSGYDKEFAKRLYIYNYRISDRFNKEVITLAVLTDENENYRPDNYKTSRWGCEISFKYPLIKLIDFKDKIDIQKAVNPFEIITFAHLKNLETKKNYDDKLFWKITLVKALYKKGLSKDDILNLYRFLDWIMVLPEDIKLKFHEEIIKHEEESNMPFITTAESIGIEKGIKKGIKKGIEKGIKKGVLDRSGDDVIEVLEIRFGFVHDKTIKTIKQIKEAKTLKILLRKAVTVGSLEDFDKILLDC